MTDILDICTEAFMKMINVTILYATVALGAYFV